MSIRSYVFFWVGATTMACSGGGESGDTDVGVPADAPTYYADIAPILAGSCVTCHVEGGMKGDLPLDEAESASTFAPLVGLVVGDRIMPPFYAEESDECPNPWGWKHDPRLTDDEIALVEDWAAAGGPIGDPETASPLPLPTSTDLADVDVEIHPPGTWTTDVFGTVEDQFVCFSIDPGLADAEWLEAFQVLPDDSEVVHHVLVGLDHVGESAALADENGVYDCFGGFGVDATFIGGWIPGSSPIEMPTRSALRLDTESRIVLQMHYHLIDEARQDGTGVALRFASEAPVREAYFDLIGNASSQDGAGNGLQSGPNDDGRIQFSIPADVSDHTETMKYDIYGTLPRGMQVFLVANHMHYVGTDMRMWLERGPEAPDDEEACLLHTPNWDFDWQQFYHYDANAGAAPTLWPGDILWLECGYDNTLDNPSVAHALAEAGEASPTTVSLGDGSLDEMCIGVLGTVFDVPLETEGETHFVEAVSEIEIPAAALSDSCVGPASFAVTGDTMSGLMACGLEFQGTLLTLEYRFDGEVSGDGASGELALEVVGVEETGRADWTGSLEGDIWTISFDGSGVFSGFEVSFSSVFELSAN